jgi:hypothetical protein
MILGRGGAEPGRQRYPEHPGGHRLCQEGFGPGEKVHSHHLSFTNVN